MRQLHGDVDEIETEGTADPESAAAVAPAPPRPLRIFMGAVVTLCLAATAAHLLLVFLHVAPSNPISQRLHKPISAWIFPVFEQNWLLFAPNPQSYQTDFYARTGWTTAAGDHETSEWFDIGTADLKAIRHDPYPSHQAQNMLRRAWGAYQDAHGNDDVSHDANSLERAKYLRNIAVQRVAGRSPHPFQVIRLKVVTRPIPPPSADGSTPTNPPDPDTRILPWWNVTPDGN